MAEVIVEPDNGEGERLHANWQFSWIETGNEIAAGALIVPIAVQTSDVVVEHASLHLAADDLRLAQESFVEAAKPSVSDGQGNLSKALIHAGIISYARPFVGGVRGFRLSAEFFSMIWNTGDIDRHKYLYTLRDKHVAHSVNDFERAATVGVVVTDASYRLWDTNPSGVGVVKQSIVGLTKPMLQDCPRHIERMLELVDTRIVELRQLIHAEMRSQLTLGDIMKLTPLVKSPNRSKIAVQRR